MEEDFCTRQNTGILFYKSSDFTSALLIFNHLLQDYPSYHEAHYNVAVTLEKLQQYEEAKDEFLMAVQLNNSIAEYHSHLAAIYKELHHYLQAERSIQRAIQLEPDEPDYHFQYGSLWAEKNQLELSNQEFQKTIHLNSEYTPAYLSLGSNYQKMERWEEAKEQYLKVLALFPDDTSTHAHLARYYIHQKNWHSALQEIHYALALETDNKEYLTILASIQYGLLDIEKAIEIALHVKVHFPEYSPCYEILGRCYAVKTEYENAISYYQQAILYDELNLDAWLGLRTIYERTGDDENWKNADEKIKSITAKEKTLS